MTKPRGVFLPPPPPFYQYVNKWLPEIVMGFPLTFNVLLEGILSRTQLEISAQIKIQKMYPSLPVALSWIEPALIMHLQKSFYQE